MIKIAIVLLQTMLQLIAPVFLLDSFANLLLLPHSICPAPGWQSIQGAFDQVPNTSPIPDGGAVHDGGDAQ